MTAEQLPGLYTLFNACALLHIVLGITLIKRGQRQAHMASMMVALLFSAAFLACYLYYHFTVGHVRFAGTGLSRPIYFGLLITHIPLAIVNLPFIILTVLAAIRGDFAKHRRWAKLSLPIWIYVSITGIIIYLMCYVWYGPPLRG